MAENKSVKVNDNALDSIDSNFDQMDGRLFKEEVTSTTSTVPDVDFALPMLEKTLRALAIPLSMVEQHFLPAQMDGISPENYEKFRTEYKIYLQKNGSRPFLSFLSEAVVDYFDSQFPLYEISSNVLSSAMLLSIMDKHYALSTNVDAISTFKKIEMAESTLYNKDLVEAYLMRFASLLKRNLIAECTADDFRADCLMRGIYPLSFRKMCCRNKFEVKTLSGAYAVIRSCIGLMDARAYTEKFDVVPVAVPQVVQPHRFHHIKPSTLFDGDRALAAATSSVPTRTPTCWNCCVVGHTFGNCLLSCRQCPGTPEHRHKMGCPHFKVGDDNIIIDSGATAFFINSKEYFANSLQPMCARVNTANGVQSPITAKGMFFNYPALYAPEFDNSLFSVPAYTADDNVCIFSKRGAFGFKDSPILNNLINNVYNYSNDFNLLNMSATLTKGLYKTSFNNLANMNSNIAPALPSHTHLSSPPGFSFVSIAPALPLLPPPSLDFDLFAGATIYYKSMAFPMLADLVRYWHEALSHASVDDLCYIVDKYPMQFPKELTTASIRKYFPACAACAVGSLSQLPLPTSTAISTAEIGEEWFIDIWTASGGGKPFTSFSGGRYSFLAKCRTSKFLYAHIIRSRLQLFKLCEKLYIFCKAKGRTMHRIITDNEFLKSEILEWTLTKVDLTIHACVPHEHGQIGQIEREHRTLMDGVVKAIHGKPHLTMKYWAMAYMDCIFKRSLLPRRSLQGSSPFFEWHGRHINLHDTPIIPFGSIVMAHIPLSEQTNLGGRAFETYSVGCAPAHKGGVTLFNPVTKRYVIRRTIKVLGPTKPISATTQLPIILMSSTDDDNIDDHGIIVDPENFVDTTTPIAPSVSTPITTITAIPVSASILFPIPANIMLPSVSAHALPLIPVVAISSSPTPATTNKKSAVQQRRKSSKAIVNNTVVFNRPYKPRVRRPQGSAAQTHSAFTAVVDSCITENLTKDQFNSFVDNFISSIPVCQKKMLSNIKSTVSTSLFPPYRATNDLLRDLPGDSIFMPQTAYSAVLNSVPVQSSQSPITNDSFIPRSCHQALTSHLWSPTIDSECDSFRSNNTYKLPDAPISSIPKDLILPSKAVFDIKYNPDGSFKKRKCRICIRGDRWVNFHDNDTYAGTARNESVKMILALSAELNLELESFDVKTAFLLPPLKEGEIIYMRRPAGLTDAHMPEVVQLLKCIYGLPLASAYFREHSDKVLKTIGFVQTISDPQVYILRRDKEFVIVATHVDDFEVAATSTTFMTEIKMELSKTYELSSVPDMSSFLGLSIVRNRSKKTIFINQPGYITDLITDYKIDMSIDFPLTPMRTDYGCHLSSKVPSNLDVLLPPALNTDFRSKVGALSFLAVQTRPDIMYAVNTLSRKSKSANLEDLEAINRVLFYIAGSRHLGLLFRSGEGIRLYSTVDASYASHNDLKSHSGCTLHIGKNSASFLTLTKKQTVLADSSTVAEYIATHLAAKQIMWTRNFLFELGFEQETATILFEDNMSTIAIIGKNGNGNKTKHIQLRFNFIREQVKDKTITMKYLPTTDMISDILTKPLGPTAFLYLRSKLLGSEEIS